MGIGKIKAKLTDQIPQPVPITVEGYGELLIHPWLLEEQATITQAQMDKRNPGRATVLMIWFALRKIEPEVTFEDVNGMNLSLPENNKLVEAIGKVMLDFSSFRPGNTQQ